MVGPNMEHQQPCWPAADLSLSDGIRDTPSGVDSRTPRKTRSRAGREGSGNLHESSHVEMRKPFQKGWLRIGCKTGDWHWADGN